MTEFDISQYMFAYDEYHAYKTGATLGDIISWLEENIGAETEKNTLTAPVSRKGHGWEIQTRKRKSDRLNEFISKKREYVNIISWHLCIEDDRAAVLFALRWGLK